MIIRTLDSKRNSTDRCSGVTNFVSEKKFATNTFTDVKEMEIIKDLSGRLYCDVPESISNKRF